MSIPLSVQTNPTHTSHDHLEKPINSNNIDTMEAVHLHMALPLQKSDEFSELQVRKKDSTAAIGPLGLLGFGLTTILLNLGNAGVFDMAPPVLAMCYGGLAQLIAGVMEWKKGNNFTSVAFISFATFWWSFVSIHAIPSLNWIKTDSYASSLHTSMGWYLILWFVFTFIMFIASFMLAAHNFAEHENTLKAAG